MKLADYSISRCVLPTGTKGFAGTPGFMAPEILKFNGKYYDVSKFQPIIDMFNESFNLIR